MYFLLSWCLFTSFTTAADDEEDAGFGSVEPYSAKIEPQKEVSPQCDQSESGSDSDDDLYTFNIVEEDIEFLKAKVSLRQATLIPPTHPKQRGQGYHCRSLLLVVNRVFRSHWTPMIIY